ncbi:cotranscriptional regulator ARB2A homolog isoform X2 [Brachyhypopomus gauderio]|uniref:cotranscriptional regulator ARB2A homolog isoform X2 n=1 Tax=Brachyhypopomus gauderio TaxID=698409 RepID=UPI00404122BA
MDNFATRKPESRLSSTTRRIFTGGTRRDTRLWIITQYVYERLEQDCGLRRETLPVDATEDEPKSFVYVSEDALTNPARLLVLIQGSGVVRAGQWARRLIINNDLDSGTQIPFINRAMETSVMGGSRIYRYFRPP